MMTSFFMIQLVLQFLSTLITLLVIFGMFRHSMNGSMVQFTILLMLVSVSGMLFGELIISVLSQVIKLLWVTYFLENYPVLTVVFHL